MFKIQTLLLNTTRLHKKGFLANYDGKLEYYNDEIRTNFW